MSEEVIMTNQSTDKPQITYLKNYTVPVYLIDEIDLIFDLYETHATVKSFMKIRHNRLNTKDPRDLVLNGEDLNLESIKIDGKSLTDNDYHLHDQRLIIKNVPDNFDLEILVKIYPQKNTALSG